MEWSATLENLIIRYKQGDLSALVDAEIFAAETSENFKSLAYIYVAQFSLLNNDFVKAEAAVENAYTYFSPHSEYIDDNILALSKILLYFYKGWLLKSLEILNQNQFQDHHQFQYWIGECYYWLGNFAQAYQHYEKSKILSAKNELLAEEHYLAKIGQSKCLMELNKLEDAEKNLQTLLNICVKVENLGNETSVLIPSELIKIFALQEKFSEAYQILQTHLNISNIINPYYRAQAIFARGFIHFMSEEYNLAREDFLEITQMNIRTWEKLEAFYYLCKIEESFEHYITAKFWKEKLDQFPEIFLVKKVQNIFIKKNKNIVVMQNENIENNSTKKTETELNTVNPLQQEIFQMPIETQCPKSPVIETGINPFLNTIPLEFIIEGISSIRYEQKIKRK